MTRTKDTLRAVLARLLGQTRTHAAAVHTGEPGTRQGALSSLRPAVQTAGAAFHITVQTFSRPAPPVIYDALHGMHRAGATVWPFALPAAQSVRVECEPVQTVAAQGQTPFAPPVRPAVRAVPATMKTGRVRVPLLPPGTKAHEHGAWLSGHVPVVRKRLPLSALLAEQQKARLAAAADTSADDIQLAGAYPSVPLTLVRHMALAEGGRSLRLWLRPKGRQTARLWTVTLGRVRSTGRAVQCVTEDAAP